MNQLRKEIIWQGRGRKKDSKTGAKQMLIKKEKNIKLMKS
jgi:hypothetical protein